VEPVSNQPLERSQAAQGDDELNLGDLLRVALSHYKLILGVALMFAVIGILYAFLWPPTYQASTTVKVPDSSQSMKGMLQQLVPTGGDPVETYVEVCKSDSVAMKVAEELKLATQEGWSEMTPLARLETLQNLVGISNVKKSNVIAITAKSKDPQRAADIANTWAKAFIEVNLDLSHAGAKSKREFLEKQSQMMKDRLNDPSMRLNQESKADELLYAKLLSDLQGAKLEETVNDAGIVVVDPAVTPEKPISPKKKRSVMLAFILGLALGFQLAFLMDRMRDHVFNEDVLKAKTGLPNYAIVPDYHEEYPEGFEPPSAVERFSPKTLIQNPVFQHAFYRESFKVLRTNLT